MKFLRQLLLPISVALLLSACTHQKVGTIEAINQASPQGSSFTQRLTNEYKAMVNTLQGSKLSLTSRTSGNALHFARKGISAAGGTPVLPEVLADWDLSRQSLEEMTPARVELLHVLDAGGRQSMPDVAAVAQSRFDCWVMEEENDRGARETRYQGSASCKSEFNAALASLKAALPARPVAEMPAAPVPEVQANIQEPVEPPERYVVFFDWDKAVLTQRGTEVLKEVIKEVSAHPEINAVVVTGHTDTTGSHEYDDALSLKRAKVVSSYLGSHGISADRIRISARGKRELLVPTPDQVRQPENRRVSIYFE